MDYEKAYKEALEAMSDIIPDENGLVHIRPSDIFHKLKESEDEKIRKSITAIINNYVDNSNTFKPKMIAWLEKQGQKPVDKVEPKFEIGDFIVNDYCMGKVIKLTNDAYLLDTGQCIPFSCEHNVHLWNIQDAKDGDVLLSKYNQPFIYNGIFDEESVGAYCGIDKLGNDFLVDNFSCDWSYKEGVKPATKEQCNLLFQKMKEAGYVWDADKKELQKSKWTEEDEKNWLGIMFEIEANKSNAPDYDIEVYDRFLSWLESLKQRVKQ